MHTHQYYLNSFERFCGSVISRNTPNKSQSRNLQSLITSLEGFGDRIKRMEREMVNEANRILREFPDNNSIDGEQLKTDLTEIAKSYILKSGVTL